MATKKSSAKASAKRKSAVKKAPSSVLDRVLDAGLGEAAITGWRNTTMAAIASRADIGLGEVLALVPTKAYFVLRLLDRVDILTFAGVKGIDNDNTPRDHLFDIMMRRFDVLNSYRDGFKSVVAATVRDPAVAPFVLCRLRRSLAAMLAAAGISPDGLAGLLRVKGLAVVSACVLRVWMRDDSTDLAKTMAALDRALARAECLAGFSPFQRRRETGDTAA